MRIAYICADFGIPILGYKGASVHVRELVSALTTDGHEVQVFSPNPGTGNSLVAPLHPVSPDRLPETLRRVVRRSLPGAQSLDKEVRELVFNVTLFRSLRKEWQRWHPDAIYERYTVFNLAGAALARRIGVPHLLEVNAPLRLERARTKGLRLDSIAGLIERRLFRSADGVLTVTAALRRYVLGRGGRAERTLVVPNGVDVDRFSAGRNNRQTMRARWGLRDDEFVIGFAGSLKSWHGTETLIDAFGLLHRSEPDLHLLIVGEGPMDESLRARAGELGLAGSITFTGKVAHSDMPRVLAAMDAGVAPYLDAPDFYFSPLKIYEYMAAGLPVVASDAGDIATLVREGETGLLSTPGDPVSLSTALRRLVESPSLRRALSTAASAEAARHTWLDNARLVANLADSLAERVRPHRLEMRPEAGLWQTSQ